MLLLGVGDSVTAGFGVREDLSYFARLVRNPPDEFPEMQGICLSAVFPNLEVKQLAISGSTSLEHIEVLRERLPRQPPDVLGVVVMTTGGNDIIHAYGRQPPREGAMYGATLDQARPWIAAFEKRLHAMLTLIEERFPGGCHIFLGDIYDPTDGVGDARSAGLPDWPDGLAILAAYNDIIHRAGQSRPRVHVVPIHATFLGHGIHCRQFWRRHYRAEDPTYWYAPNLEDPTERGYDALRRIFLLEMLKADLHRSDQAARTQATKASSPPGALTPVGYPT
ncbi:MAG: SGNH/GDSL hydrolase family protein [Thermoguttaceae bacterium]|nr:SGNH/GDSL hydrolase family protein [Thermoguttaceae bacterium]